MQIEIISDDYYAKRDLRRCVTAARRRFEEHRPSGRFPALPVTFRFDLRVQPRIRSPRFVRGGWRGAELGLPKKGLTQGALVDMLAWTLMRCIHADERHRPHATAVWQERELESSVFRGTRLEPKPETPKPEQTPDGRYQKCLREIGQAQARIVTLEKQLDRAQKHLAKKEKEAKRRAGRLTRTLVPGEKLSSAYLSARLRMSRKNEQITP